MPSNITNNDEPRKAVEPWLSAYRALAEELGPLMEWSQYQFPFKMGWQMGNAVVCMERDELLEALSRMIEPYNGWSDEELARRVDVPTFDRITRAQAAIAKALGQ